MDPKANNRTSNREEKEKFNANNKSILKRDEERIDEEVNLISSQTDDTEDELDEEEDDKRLEEG